MIFGREPAFLIGVLFSAVFAVLQVLNGNGLIGDDLLRTVGIAIDPTQGGWLLPIIIGLVTRVFVSPAERPGL